MLYKNHVAPCLGSQLLVSAHLRLGIAYPRLLVGLLVAEGHHDITDRDLLILKEPETNLDSESPDVLGRICR